jgi:hypothetical protein
MTVDNLVALAQSVCFQNGRTYPNHLRAMASQWNREGMEIASVWADLRSALAQGLPVEPLDLLLRKRHAAKVAEADAKLAAACPVLSNEQRYVRHEWPRQSSDINWRGFDDN